MLVNRVHFSGEYVESLPPAERKLQIFYYQEDEKEKAKAMKKRQGNSGPTIGSPPAQFMGAMDNG